MAYAFSTIRDSMGNDTMEKTNIFSPTGLESGLNTQVGINQGGVKTDAGGDGMSGGGTPGETTDQSAGQIAQQRGARQAISRNAGRINTQALTNVSNSMKSADSALQDEANKYVAGAQQKAGSFGVDDATVDSYVRGENADSGAKIKGLLDSEAPEYEAFAPKTDVTFGNVDDLQTDEGFKNVLRKEGGPEYTAGMGAFDVSAARRSPQFAKLRADLKTEREALRAKADKLSEGTTKAGREAVKSGFTTAQNALKSGLTEREKALIDAQIAEVEALNAAAPKLTADDFIEMGAGVRRKAMDETPDEARLDNLIWGSGVSAKDFYSSPTSDWRDVIDDSEAAQFNRIMSALGRSDPDSVYTPGAGPKQPSFDEDAYRKAVIEAAQGKRGELDTKTRAEIDSYLKSVAGELPTRIDARRKNEIQDVNRRLYNEFGEDLNKVQLDPTAFYGAGTTYGAPDFFVKPEWAYDEKDVNSLNSLYQSLGEQNPYAVGQGLDIAFDDQGYESALRQAVTELRRKASNEAYAQEKVDNGEAVGTIGEDGEVQSTMPNVQRSSGGGGPKISAPAPKKTPTRIPVVSDTADVLTGKKKINPRKWF